MFIGPGNVKQIFHFRSLSIDLFSILDIENPDIRKDVELYVKS